MGLGIGFSSNSSPRRGFSCKPGFGSFRESEIAEVCTALNRDTTPNPNPFRFKIEKHEVWNGNTVLVVHYPDCTTFGGYKILVLKGIFTETSNITVLDPHFLEGNHPVIARFLPSDSGLRLARLTAQNYEEDSKA